LNSKSINVPSMNIAEQLSENNNGSRSLREKKLLKDFLIAQLQDLYWIEMHLLSALPKMKKAASTSILTKAFESHYIVTKKQVSKLEEVFTILEEKATSGKSEAMESLTKDTNDLIDRTEEGTLTRDVALILSAHRVEHYEIASYEGLAQLAKMIGENEVANKLEEILAEEQEADDALNHLSVGNVNDGHSEPEQFDNYKTGS
jgi:ferritin-like metal-binding protein YciE